MLNKNITAQWLSRWLTQATRRIEVIENGLYTVKIGDQDIFMGVPNDNYIHTAQTIRPDDSHLISKISELIFADSVDNARIYLTRLKQIHKENEVK